MLQLRQQLSEQEAITDQLRGTIRRQRKQIAGLQSELCRLKANKQINDSNSFSVKTVSSSRIKNLFTYYIGFSFATFIFIFNLLVKPDATEPPFHYIGSKKSFTNLSLKDQLFLVFC